MIPLVLGLLVFAGIHLLPTQPDIRQGLARRFGDLAYKGVFSLVSIVGLALIVYGYHKVQLNPGKNPQLWSPPTWGRHAAMALMLPVFPLLAMTYLRGTIAAAVRHPMITAVKLWALAHLLVRGDAASVLLFGGLLAWAIFDRVSLKGREVAGQVVVKPAGPMTFDAIAIVAGLAIYAVMLKWGHGYVIGMPLLR